MFYNSQLPVLCQYRQKLSLAHLAVIAMFLWGTMTFGAELYVGCESVSITPDQPVMLQGQMHTRISTGVETPVTANVLALETRENGKTLDQMVIVSLDLCTIIPRSDSAIRAAVKKHLPEFDVQGKLMLSSTHTHTGPVTSDDYVSDRTDYMLPKDYTVFLADRVSGAVERAVKNKVRSEFSFGLSYAVVGFNRRAVYQDGHAAMYGQTNTADFAGIEGFEDHSINTMFFWNEQGKLLATIVNVSCPSQEVEGASVINADYWHPVREQLKAKYGKELCVLGLCGAAGDLSPHLLYNKRAYQRMRDLAGINSLTQIAERIVAAVEIAYPLALKDKRKDVVLTAVHQTLDLPQLKIPVEIYEQFKKDAAVYKEKVAAAPDRGANGPYTFMNWYQGVVDRYENQQKNPNATFAASVHVVRIGDAVLCSNPFELYSDYATIMKARSKAIQTFVVQLTDAGPGGGGYLPTPRAVAGGGYGAVPQSNEVGPEGGKILTEKTIEMINAIF